MHNNHRILLTLLVALDTDKPHTTRELKSLIWNNKDILGDYHKNANIKLHQARWKRSRYEWNFDDFDRISRGLRSLAKRGYISNVSTTRIRQFTITDRGLEKAKTLLGEKALALTDHRDYVRQAAIKIL